MGRVSTGRYGWQVDKAEGGWLDGRPDEYAGSKRRGARSLSASGGCCRMTDRMSINQYRRVKPRTVRRDYKKEFLDQLHLAGLPTPEAEVAFASPRRWRFDWAFKDQQIAIEYQGGNYTGKGGHNTVKGLRNDYEKFSEAAIRGWLLILIDSGSVRDGRAVTWVERALRARLK